jgi:hypothetical protein
VFERVELHDKRRFMVVAAIYGEVDVAACTD